ncbi:putative 2-oxoglutarate/Fe(II)-dependent dioxygenase YbiX [Paraburkholderia bannensis]|uniref:Putative 2-oxoglutarate/Fe(II)-dependent dioxygenase YbiX n=1 Tax=Paraburkholderia bannensis TaxID=765414 RepID=A0A7W9WU51_9BURK|nr:MULTISPECIES: hypothetical protein [Paraburkholderia]MBB3258455.1 putative 2-oxoglutarate/Fe(II)-dependent dioxygenase YbiX [Paraburkholderia sp. WP4_3_2]MBB6103468.1 putative 2-oxoglutarate/Fe(II)-dependent dioxygenase YbiX [Paraburkholderia bannensis]
MIVKIPNVLSPEEVRYCRDVLGASEWGDGKARAGEQARDVKDNLQIEMGSEPFREMGERVLRALGRNSLFNSLTIPLRVRSPMFNRYDFGMHYGPHVDGAIHSVPGDTRDALGGIFLDAVDRQIARAACGRSEHCCPIPIPRCSP